MVVGLSYFGHSISISAFLGRNLILVGHMDTLLAAGVLVCSFSSSAYLLVAASVLVDYNESHVMACRNNFTDSDSKHTEKTKAANLTLN